MCALAFHIACEQFIDFFHSFINVAFNPNSIRKESQIDHIFWTIITPCFNEKIPLFYTALVITMT